MYNVKGPSKIAAKTARRGISQNMEPYRDHTKKNMHENDYEDPKMLPRPIFQKKLSPNTQKAEISPDHEDIIRFIHESWNSVCLEMDREHENIGDSGEHTTVCYYEEEPCENLQNFKSFDLESWWGKRLYAYITNAKN